MPITSPSEVPCPAPSSSSRSALQGWEDPAICEKRLRHLSDQEGMRGAALIGRDGRPLGHRFRRACSIEILSAMGAAILGAADAALLDLGPGATRSFIARSAAYRIGGVALDSELALLLVAEAKMPEEALQRLVDEEGRRSARALKEA